MSGAIALPPKASGFSYRQEVGRKLIHVSSLWMPLAIYHLERATAAALIGAALAAVLLFEWLRRQPGGLGNLLNRLFAPVIRAKETAPGFRLTGASYVLMAALIVCLFFPQPVAVASLSIMLLADSAAALIGRRFGKTPILDKSLEGSVAFLLTALLAVIGIAWVSGFQHHFLMAGLFASIVATATELCSSLLHLDDNLTITLIAACAMWLVMFGF